MDEMKSNTTRPGAILLVHQGTTDPDFTIEELRRGDVPKDIEIVRITPDRRRLEDYDETYDWEYAAARQQKQFDELRTAQRCHPNWPIIYFGLVPIPLAIHLGWLVGSCSRVSTRVRHHQTFEWGWPGGPEPSIQSAPLASGDPRFEGDLVIRVSTAARIDPGDTQVDPQIRESDIALAQPALDAIVSEKVLNDVAATFTNTLMEMSTRFPQARIRHLFAAVPTGLAFRMGTCLNTTHMGAIQTWQYNGSSARRYHRAIALGRYRSAPTLLILAAAPHNAARISAVAEVQELHRQLEVKPNIRLIERPATAAARVLDELSSADPTFLHIAGHGRGTSSAGGRELVVDGDSSEGGLFFLNSEGEGHLMTNSDFIALTRDLRRLRCVVLTTCHSAELAKELDASGKLAIGFVGPLNDTAGRDFAQTFWRYAVEGRTFRRACELAEIQIRAQHQITLEYWHSDSDKKLFYD